MNAKASHANERPGDDENLVSVVARRVRLMLQAHQDVPLEGLHPTILREVERALLTTVLEHTQGHREEAATILGLHRNSLRRRLRAVGLEPEPVAGRRPSRSTPSSKTANTGSPKTRA